MELVIDAADRLLRGLPAPEPPKTAEEARVQASLAACRAARGIASAVLAYPPCLDAEAAGVEPEQLGDQFARDVFVAARAVYSASPSDRCDLAAVYERVAATGRWDNRKLAGEIYDLCEQGGAGADAGYYVRALRLASLVRGVYGAADELTRVAAHTLTDGRDEQELRAAASGVLDAATEEPDGSGPARVSAELPAVLASVARPRADGVPTGLADFDNMVPPLHAGQYVVVAARPSVGKTALGLTVALNVAHCLKRTVLVSSLEMSTADVVLRAAVMATASPVNNLRVGRQDPAALAKVGRATRILADTPLWIDDRAGATVAQIASSARRVRRREGLSLLVVDYLQLAAAGNRRADRREQVEEVSRGLKQLAKELQVPVLAMAQLNREVESRPDGRPRLADIREAGGVEQDADVVLLLWRVPNQPDGDIQRVGCHVAKHRNGPTGEFELAYRRPTMVFENLEETPPD